MSDLLKMVIEDAMTEVQRIEWEQRGKPIGRATRDIKAGEPVTISLDVLHMYAQLGIPEETPLE